MIKSQVLLHRQSVGVDQCVDPSIKKVNYHVIASASDAIPAVTVFNTNTNSQSCSHMGGDHFVSRRVRLGSFLVMTY